MRSSAPTEKSGVPMKMTRKGDATRRTLFADGGGSLAELFLLGESAQDHVPLQRRDMIHEQRAFEVVDLVLDDDGKQAVRLHLAFGAGLVEIADADFFWPRHHLVFFRQREAAFLMLLLRVGTPDD